MYTAAETLKAIALTALVLALVIGLTAVALATLPINPWVVIFGAFFATIGAIGAAAEILG